MHPPLPRLTAAHEEAGLEAYKLAKSQYGAICWAQVERLGFNRLRIKRRVRAEDWVRLVRTYGV